MILKSVKLIYFIISQLQSNNNTFYPLNAKFLKISDLIMHQNA